MNFLAKHFTLFCLGFLLGCLIINIFSVTFNEVQDQQDVDIQKTPFDHPMGHDSDVESLGQQDIDMDYRTALGMCGIYFI